MKKINRRINLEGRNIFSVNKVKTLILCILAIFVLLASFISAFGVSSHYWGDNPLKLAPGESKEVVLGLQNMVGGEDLTLEAMVTNDEGIIASIADEKSIYSVPFGTKDREILVNVSVPGDAEAGKIYKVIVSLRQISTEGGGMLQITGGVTSTIPVQIVSFEESHKRVEEPPRIARQNGNLLIISTIVLLVVALTIFFVARRKIGRKQKNRTNKF